MTQMNFIRAGLISLALACAHTPASALVFTANLTHDQESSQGAFLTSDLQPRPESFGTATLVLNDTMTALTFTVTVFNIDFTGDQTTDTNDNLLAAHIHAPAPPGTNGGVVFGFIGNPFSDTNPTDTVVTPFVSGVGGTVSTKWDLAEGNNTTLDAQIANIEAGLAYLNFHTVQFPGGEIRGQIVSVPDAGSSLIFAAVALSSLMAFAGRRRRQG